MMPAPSGLRSNRSVARRYGRTYYLASRLLAPEARPGIWAIYAFCRRADDIVDGTATPDEKRRGIDELEAMLERALVRGESDDPALDALVWTYDHWQIPPETLDRFLGAMRRDLTEQRYQRWEDLLGYMEGSAAVIGEMVLPILGGPPAAREPARALGLAFQLTNFIRDVGEDLDRGRIYLPLEDVTNFGALDDLLARRPSPALRELVSFEIERARTLYAASLAADHLLPRASRRCVGVARELYSAIVLEVERNGYDVLTRRAIVPRRRRAAEVVRALVSPRELPRILEQRTRA